jgi:hypothetical protein
MWKDFEEIVWKGGGWIISGVQKKVLKDREEWKQMQIGISIVLVDSKRF